jgi:hypothetical protein
MYTPKQNVLEVYTEGPSPHYHYLFPVMREQELKIAIQTDCSTHSALRMHISRDCTTTNFTRQK